RSRSITGTWIEAARLSASALFPAPLLPIITVRWIRDSNIGPTAEVCRRVHPSSARAGYCNGSAPKTRGTPKLQPVRTSGSDLGRLDLQTLTGACDRDRPRLHRLRNLALEVDVQEPVLQPCALDAMSLRAELVRLGLRWFVKRKIGPATTLEALRRQDAFLERLVPPPP